jgi:hypothetical protein
MPVVARIKLFLICSVIVCAAITARRSSLAQPADPGAKKEIAYKSFSKIYDSDKDESPSLKRKYKVKGIEIAAIVIGSLIFNQYYSFSAIVFSGTENLYTHSPCFSRHNKGPPALEL